jgi:hypothetical protein
MSHLTPAMRLSSESALPVPVPVPVPVDAVALCGYTTDSFQTLCRLRPSSAIIRMLKIRLPARSQQTRDMLGLD